MSVNTIRQQRYIGFLSCQRSQHSKLYMSPKQQKTDNKEREETGKAE